ncbi:hypothetical protein SEUCBS139899_002927 [Sporothrix eucalyptigena]|uniref:NmrA-like domain-containing protein n=1 Tax=Sporothrix eucalyptigena TaxID=1812306 RepID=A0ABP0D2Q1_9PEZI
MSSASKLRVALLGATGETGSSIMRGLLASTQPHYEITALARAASVNKPALLEYKKQGVQIAAVDLDGPEDALAATLKDFDVVISAIGPAELMQQVQLANACKAAGVGRFVPCCFATIVPPKGILVLRDIKEDIINHIKKIYLPYTIIDVGWWYNTTLPRLPSGKIDYALPPYEQSIAGEGTTPYALTDVGDIGIYTARIVGDPRTLNKYVFAYTELKTQLEIYDLIEKLSGEKVVRNHVSREDIAGGVAKAEATKLVVGTPEFYQLAIFQYWNTWGVRGDNQPEYAKYLGYLLAKDLYPDLQGKPYLQYCQEVLDGRAHGVYKGITFFE